MLSCQPCGFKRFAVIVGLVRPKKGAQKAFKISFTETGCSLKHPCEYNCYYYCLNLVAEVILRVSVGVKHLERATRAISPHVETRGGMWFCRQGRPAVVVILMSAAKRPVRSARTRNGIPDQKAIAATNAKFCLLERYAHAARRHVSPLQHPGRRACNNKLAGALVTRFIVADSVSSH